MAGWMPTLRLEADDLDTLYLDPDAGWFVQQLDLGFPVVREVVQNAPDADGTIDTTGLVGARNVSLELVIDAAASEMSLWQMTSLLKAFLSPRRRVRLVGQFEEGGDEKRVVLRGSKWSDGGPRVRSDDVVRASWVAPSGLIESAELHSVTAPAGDYNLQSGRTYDLTHDRTYPAAGASSGGALATNAGNVPVWPIVTMYGPASAGIVLLNDTTGEQMGFTSSLSIASGDWIKVDFAAKTIVNSAGTSYYDTLDFPGSTWWQLAPGDNRIYMVPTTSTVPPAAVQVDWRDGWL